MTHHVPAPTATTLFDVHRIGIPAFTVDVGEDLALRFGSLNAVHSELTGLREADLLGRTPQECLPADLARHVGERYMRCVLTGRHQDYEEVFDLPNGRFWWRTSLTPLVDRASGRVVAILGLCVDVTADKARQDELERGAYFDPVTGIANRRRLDYDFDDAIASAIDMKRPFSVLLAEVEGYASLTARLGADGKDAALRQVALRLREGIRANDRLAHVGDGRFVAILSAATEGALAVALDRLRRVFAAAQAADATALPLRFGGSVWSPGASPETLTRAAEAAMHTEATAGDLRSR
ncbi:GGDEF domain-containing protein [Aureimonas sp. AU12]|uniref:GGDEF domain-containing protein n=1 Tax=Aureimonas sp. AU12 TaxID=1638161 RepID=UPI000782AE6D|nr:GGDEF domain-containing protein [Aureimonas sp. AU12]